MKSFTDYYTLDQNINGKEGQEGMLETYGDDWIKVKQAYKNNPNKVWTIVDDSDSDNVLVIAGLHYVNRIAYLVTNEEYKEESEAYLDD